MGVSSGLSLLNSEGSSHSSALRASSALSCAMLTMDSISLHNWVHDIILSMDRTCKVCEKTKNIELFPLRERGLRRRTCKQCWSKTNRSPHYERNKERIDAQNKAWRIETRRNNFRNLWDYFKDHPCVDCGETDFRVLEFDHRDTEIKLGAISAMMSHVSWQTIADEIAKCDVRCANCHKRRTSIQLGWYKEYEDFLPNPNTEKTIGLSI